MSAFVDAAGCFVLLLNYIVQLPYIMAKTPQILFLLVCAPQEREVHVQIYMCVSHSRKHIAKTPVWKMNGKRLNYALSSLILVAMRWFDLSWGFRIFFEAGKM